MGKKSADNLVAAIEASKHRTLDRFLTGLTIRHVGTRMAEVIAARVQTLETAPRDVARGAGGDPRGRPGRRGQHPRVLPGPRATSSCSTTCRPSA